MVGAVTLAGRTLVVETLVVETQVEGVRTEQARTARIGYPFEVAEECRVSILRMTPV